MSIYDFQNMKEREIVYKLLKNQLPEQFLEFCYELYLKSPFQLVITRDRKSKLGDYRFSRREKHHRISLNYNLNPYSFLITYLHEVAHRNVMLKYGPGKKPHGEEWKSEFRKILIAVLILPGLPVGLEKELASYARNPRASSYRHRGLADELRKYDQEQVLTLNDLEDGQLFNFKGEVFRKIKSRRTRVLCEKKDTGQSYLIAGVAAVDEIQKLQSA